MANLSTLLGSGIKSIQKGSISLTAQTSNTATITAVDPTKSFILHNGSVTNTGNGGTILLALTNATTVTASSLASTTATVNFTVVEYA